MSKLSRAFLKLFGQDGSTNNFEQFGSTVSGSAVPTKDIATIQGLSAWLNGLQDAVYGSNKAPILEDINALLYVFGYQTVYQFQEGIAEYNSLTTYYIGSIVKKTGTSELYKSITDTNLGNALPSKADNANWQYIINRGILQYDSTYSYSIGEIAQRPGTAELYKSLTNSNVGNALPSQTNSANWQYLVDLANLAPPPVGIQSIKFGFAHVSVSSSSSTSSAIAKNPIGDFGFDADMTVYAFVTLHHVNHNINSAAPSAFTYSIAESAALSGSGVDATGAFVAGGSPASTYTLTLTMTVTTSIGTGTNQCEATAIFIGIK